ncbi:ATP-binding protein [Sedimentisphaera salicampi]|uniref:histidine kinase n=1 Tax=Sedimentisphaera salicampi TaxID=1941349 RepID=A0A1W6LL65_9BACT|nr:ATP-binding protein [Sedimentisphaera salicampi]ARN56496.1 Phytochrome-like protein cph1 [Sedimentisphaera salicampi]OXU15379.1 Phytochrome-like protein cph1 [Sedimentisphaera salicampi]
MPQLFWHKNLEFFFDFGNLPRHSFGVLGLSFERDALLVFAVAAVMLIAGFLAALFFFRLKKNNEHHTYSEAVKKGDNIFILWRPVRNNLGIIEDFEISELNNFTSKLLAGKENAPQIALREHNELRELIFESLVETVENKREFKSSYRLENLNKFLSLCTFRTQEGNAVSIGSDQTEAFNAKREKLKDVKQIEFICQLSQMLAAAGTENYRDVISEVLRKVTEYAGFERGMLFLLDKSGESFSAEYQWAVPKGEVELDDFRNVPTESIPMFAEVLKEKGSIFIRSLDDISEESVGERTFLKKKLAESSLFTGVFENKELAGFITLDSINYPPQFNENLLRVLRVTGEVLNNTVKRISATFRQFSEENRFKKLFQNMPSGFALYRAEYNDGEFEDFYLTESNQQFDNLCSRAVYKDSRIGLLCPEERDWLDNYRKAAEEGSKIFFEAFSETSNRYFEIIAASPEEGFLATIVSDRTEKIRSKNELETRIEFEESLSDSLENIAKLNNDNIEYMLKDLFRSLCSYSGADRCILEYRNTGELFSDLYSYEHVHNQLTLSSTNFVEMPESLTAKFEDNIINLQNASLNNQEREYLSKFCETNTENSLCFRSLIGSSLCTIVLSKNDSSLWGENCERMMKICSEPLVNALVRIYAEDSIKQNEEFFREIFEQAPAGILMLNYDREILSANRNCLSILEIESEEEIKGTFFEKYITIPEGKLEDIRNHKETEFLTKIQPEEEDADESEELVKTLKIRVTPQKNASESVLKRAYIVIIDDITESIKDRERIEQANIELRQSNEDLKQFAYVTSHDLQEPVRTITCYLDLLDSELEEKNVNGEAKEYLKYARNGSLKIYSVINDLLQFSKAGFKELKLEQADLGELAEEAAGDLKGLIDETEAEISIGELPTLRCDKVQIYRVFMNLISNAVRFNKKGEKPKVEIYAECIDGIWRICVKDNGIGIEESMRKEIFTIFKRLHEKPDARGTGVGLAICKKIIERHQGAVWVESELGKGSTFCFTFPS